MSPNPTSRPSGFTLLELVATMLIIGVLAAVAVPRFVGRNTFDARGYADRTRSAIDYSQKLAIATRRNVCVAVSGAGLNVTRAGAEGSATACSVAVNDPTTGTSFLSYPLPSGVTLGSSATPIIFNALGSAGNADITVTVGGDVSTIITIERVTGYVH